MKPRRPGRRLGACCSTTPSAMCFWTAMFLLAYGATLVLRVMWPALNEYANTLMLSALAIACFVNLGRNRTYHCALTGPLFLIAAVVAALADRGVWSVPSRVLWGTVAIGVAAAYLAEWHEARRRVAD